MRNKIIIFVALFIAAVAIMTLTNDKIDLNDKLVEKVYVKVDSVLNIKLNNTGNFKAKQYKVSVIENTELEDSIEIYKNELYGQYFKEYEVDVDGNNINITDNFGNLTIFYEQPFISTEQYMTNFPEIIYKIYIPQGMEYSIE